jgi:hypothetical protein
MNPRRVKTAPGFDKALRDLPPNLQEQTIQAVKQFIERTTEHSLRPERKSGLPGVWAFRVTTGVRVFAYPIASFSTLVRMMIIGP